jgi:hypothetical protein
MIGHCRHGKILLPADIDSVSSCFAIHVCSKLDVDASKTARLSTFCEHSAYAQDQEVF